VPLAANDEKINNNKDKDKDVEITGKKKKKSSTLKQLRENKSVKQWLKNNSLTALKLTILDALEPYIVQSKSDEAAQILQDYVDSKPWNDVSLLLLLFVVVVISFC